MKLKLIILATVVAFLFTGCHRISSKIEKKCDEAINCYEENKTLFSDSAVEAMALLEEHDLTGARISFADKGAVYVDAINAEIQSESLYKSLAHGVESINVSEEGVKFFLDTGGFVSSSDYSGIFYSPTEDINSLPFFLPNLEYTYDEDIVTGAKEGSDNTVYIERIEDGFFYFYLTF